MSLRKRLADILEMEAPDSGIALWVNTSIMLLISLNVLAIILESVDSLQTAYADWFWRFEIVSIVLFTLEYLTRVWVCVDNPRYGHGWRGRIRYLFTPMALIDLLAILPFYLGMFIQVDTRLLRILRLLRVFKLSRHFGVLAVLASVLRNEAKTLTAAIFVMIILVVLAAAGIYVAEREAQPQVFGSIPRAMWWATVTLTTVGYGDVVPITISGRLLGVVITVLGVGMAALPAGIIASGFTNELAHRRNSYELMARKMIRDGRIDADDRRTLSKLRIELGLDRSTAQQLLRKVTMESGVQDSAESHSAVCPHCGKSLD